MKDFYDSVPYNEVPSLLNKDKYSFYETIREMVFQVKYYFSFHFP